MARDHRPRCSDLSGSSFHGPRRRAAPVRPGPGPGWLQAPSSASLLPASSPPSDCSVLALVGDGMVSAPGVLGRAASALGKHMVNIISVAQVPTQPRV